MLSGTRAHNITGRVAVRPQVPAPDHFAGSGPLFLSSLYFLDPFIVSAQIEGTEDRLEMELDLTEWLPEFVEFLKTPDQLERDYLLTQSGSRLSAVKRGDFVGVDVFIPKTAVTVTIWMDDPVKRTFIDQLRQGLLSVIEGPAGDRALQDVQRLYL